MKKLILFGLIFLGVFFAKAQVEESDNNPVLRVKYYQDFLTFINDDGKIRLDVFVQVPYTEVQFIKTGEGFEAAYTVTVSVFDEEGEKLISEKIWNEKIISRSFDATIAKQNFNLSFRSFELAPSTYLIKTSVFDKDSRDEYFGQNVYTIRDLTVKPSISDIMLISQKTKVEGSNKLVPNISRDVTAEKNGIPIFFEVYSDSAAEVTFEYQVNELNGETAVSKSEKKSLTEGTNQVFFTVDPVTLNIGKYVLTIVMKDEGGETLATISKSFFSRWAGVPKSISNLQKAVDQLVYIANPDEIDYIEDSKNNEEKTKRFIEFWKKRDPNPKNEYNQAFEEYYKRVSYANQSFSNYTEGWRSDRGMVLIILGLPDNIDRHPFDYDAKPYEVWQYYDLNKSFVFVDNTGFGDYRLVTPLYGDLYRFRY